MCLLVVKPQNSDLADDLATLADGANPHGFGAVWKEKGKLRIEKGRMSIKEQNQVIKVIGNKQAILHWRFATGGKVDMGNCHPFTLADGSVFAHNGIFPIKPTDEWSDTRILSIESKTADELVKRISPHVGASNKVALWKPGKGIEIFGEKHGKWIDGVWYSNTYWQDSWYTQGTATNSELCGTNDVSIFDQMNADELYDTIQGLCDLYGEREVYRTVRDVIGPPMCEEFEWEDWNGLNQTDRI